MSRHTDNGWFARQEAAKARLAAGISDRLRENMQDANDRHRQDRADVEAHKALMEAKRRETLCGCPACSATGEVTQDESAFIASALAYYRSKAYAANPLYLRADKLLPRPVRDDAPVMPAVEHGTSEEAAALAELVSETPKKAKARHTPPPFLSE